MNKIIFDTSNEEILNKVKKGIFSPYKHYQLNLFAHFFSLIEEFSELLSLPHLNINHYHYQIETARKVLKHFRGRAILADEVGLGKTIEAGIVLKEYILRGLVKKILILCPPSLISQWKEEMLNKFNLEFVTTEDKKYHLQETNFWLENEKVIASLNIAKGPINQPIIKEIEYDLIIADEAHHLKNRNTISWKFVNELKKKFILLLTATPVHNDLEELFNLITLLMPGQLKTAKKFKKEFVTRGEKRKAKNIEQLRILLSEVMIRNTRSQMEYRLPKRHAETLSVYLTPEEKQLYEEITSFVREEFPKVTPHSKGLNHFILQILQMESGSSFAATSSTLGKIRNNLENSKAVREKSDELYQRASLLKEGPKDILLLNLLKKIEGKVIIFTKYIATQKLLAEILSRNTFSYSVFSGQLSLTEKEQSIQEFAQEKKVFISTEVGGEGKNLQFCNCIINYDLPWNPMKIEQRIGRIHRIGQEKEVYIFNLSSKETIESYILKILDEKLNMFELVIGEMEMILGNLDEEKEFEEIVMENLISAKDQSDLACKMEELGDNLLKAKKEYLEVMKYNLSLFKDDMEPT